jgi:hypothetical protein
MSIVRSSTAYAPMDTRFPDGAAAMVAELRRRFDEHLSATTRGKDTTKVRISLE